MLIGVISDTHDRLLQLEAALNFFHEQNIRTVVHCGDWKDIATVRYCADLANQLDISVHGVLGNNDTAVQEFLDYAAKAPGEFHLEEGVLELNLHEKSIAAYHGHHLPTRRRLLSSSDYDVILLGHSHKPLITNDADQMIVNPGSTAFAIPRSRTWQPSVGIVNLEKMTAAIHFLA
jgi:putative phosphoesterase